MKSISYLMTTALFVGLVFFSAGIFWYQRTLVTGDMIAHDVAHLVSIFERIDKTCDITSFDYQKNPINFLNVRSFTGSEVGPMNLVYPDAWQGPYVQDNPSINGREYEIVRTKAGYFITPGTGVKLPNGKVIGTDIMLDEHADIAAMARDETMLMHKGKPLAIQININQSSFEGLVAEDII